MSAAPKNTAAKSDSPVVDDPVDAGSPLKTAKTQSPTPVEPRSRRTSHSNVDLKIDGLQSPLPLQDVSLKGNAVVTVPPGSAGLMGVSPSFAFYNIGSPGPSVLGASSASATAAMAAASAGRRSPTTITNNVAASVVRNALPWESSSTPDLYVGFTQRLAAGGTGGSDNDITAAAAAGSAQACRTDGARLVPTPPGESLRGEQSLSMVLESLSPNSGYLHPSSSMTLAATTPGNTGSRNPLLIDGLPLSPDSAASFSRERAEKNFAKARDLLRERMKNEQDKSKRDAVDSPSAAGGSSSTPSAAATTQKGGGGAAASASKAGSGMNEHHRHLSLMDLPAAEDDDGDGGKLYNVIRAAMEEADTIDVAENSTTLINHSINEWRDDDDAVQAPSSFFRSAACLESTSNRVMEAIIAKGHAAATDEELRWLYRHANILNLLEKPDLDRVAAVSLRREYMKGETIANQYTNIKHLYTVVWGDVEVFRATSLDGEQRALEAALRMTAPRSSQVYSQQRSLTGSRAASTKRTSDLGDGVTANKSDGHNNNNENSRTANATCRANNSHTAVSTSTYDLLDIQSGNNARSRSLSNGLPMSNTSEEDEGADVIYTHVATLLPGQVFGTENFVFDQTNRFVFRAGGSTKKTVVALIPFSALVPSLAHNPRFAQGVGNAIAGSVDVFGPIRQFCRYVFSSLTSQNDYLPLWSIVAAYTDINNVIHTKLLSTELDTGAWGYALNRLPENVTSTFCFDLVHALPPFVASRMRVEAYAADVSKAPQPSADLARARTAVAYIRTKERRRCTWHLGMEGKDLVLLRDGFTDLLDFLTMLCVHIIESNKLRGRVQGMVHPPAIDILDEYLRTREREVAEGKAVPAEEEVARIKEVLARMPLTPDEQNGLLRNWGAETLLKIYEVMMHREEFNVRLDPSISRKFQINPFHEWALNLRGCVMTKLGLDKFRALPSDLVIDVVSSNTHCIKNLLCSFNRKYRAEILDYAVRKEGKKLGKPEDWHTIEDMIYIATSGFLRDERPDLKEEFQKSLEENGITVLHDTAMTGLQVDVIPVHLLNYDTIDETIQRSLRDYFETAVQDHGDGESGPSFRSPPTWAQVSKPMIAPNSTHLHRMQERAKQQQQQASGEGAPSSTATAGGGATPSSASPSAAASPSTQGAPAGSRLRRHFIINMDFAFGAQAEGICRAVFSAFGQRIRSVSVMGKAGGLQGKRGDIQLASHVLLSKSSLILEDNQDELRSCRNQDLTKERLQELAGPKVTVHHGKVLTVTGTMLQNAPLLRYYKNVWRCVGTEMEGSYFARVIEDFYRQGIANADLHTRFAYYTSDLPLAQSEAEEEAKSSRRHVGASATLSAPMTPQEGVPPLYAIARGILENVLLS